MKINTCLLYTSIFLSRFRDGSRKITEICEVLDYENGDINLNPLFIFEEQGEDNDGKIIGQLKSTGNELKHTYKFKQNLGYGY